MSLSDKFDEIMDYLDLGIIPEEVLDSIFWESELAYEESKKRRKKIYEIVNTLPLTEEEIYALVDLDIYHKEIVRGEDPNRFYSDVEGARRRFEKVRGTVLELAFKRELKMYEDSGFRKNIIFIYKNEILPKLIDSE